MEVKVSVDGVARVVCGVTEETTCQEVVIALAQAMGQPGRYTLRETFKDYERCMTPNEHLLETLKKYGEQSREVHFTLLHNGTSVLDEMRKTKVGRYQPLPPLRRKDAGTRMRRGSGSLSLHRQSLPPLPSLKQEAEPQKEDLKKPKRKSLSLMEEAWEWLESLGKSRVYSTACDKESSKKTDRRKRMSLDFSLSVDKKNSGENSKSEVRGQKGLNSDLDHQTSCCMGSQTWAKPSKKTQEAESEDVFTSSCAITEDEINTLRERTIFQLSCLQDLQLQIEHIDKQMFALEEKQRVRKAEQEAEQRIAEEEMEQIKFWENELKAEEDFEKELQRQFHKIKVKALECKPKLEECKHKIKGLEFFTPQDSKTDAETANETLVVSKKDQTPESSPNEDANANRKLLPREKVNSPNAPVTLSQIKERRPTGPTELREWWTRWSEAQRTKSLNKKVIHRSELTIYLSTTKV